MPLPSIFDICQPRADVLAGRLRDEDFAADLSKVVLGRATAEYSDPDLFFRHTHPTDGLRALLESACRRLSGVGGELNSVIRLDTQFGGGKTHSLIALVHAARGMKGVTRAHEFLDPAMIPQDEVRIAALDGENSDPASGLSLGDGLRAYTIWGEMAYRLAGPAGYERVRVGDEKQVAPGADTIAELFGGRPTLILIDEVAAYLRKASRVDPGAARQFPAFLQALIKAVESTPRCVLVSTLAIQTSTQAATDAYAQEQQIVLQAFGEAESIVARKMLTLDPARENETVHVLRRRLFEHVDPAKAEPVIRAYEALWDANRESLPEISPEYREQFRVGYPFHPDTLGLLTRKVASLNTFHRTRGMLRLLSRTVKHLWDTRPGDAYAVHAHHIDPGFGPIRDELTTRIGQQQYSPAINADVAAAPGATPSSAQQLDQRHFHGQPPVVSYVARTIFLSSLAYPETAQGLPAEQLRLAVASPALEPSFVEQARLKFVEESLFLDDRPGAPLRLKVEPNLVQTIQRAMRDVPPEDVQTTLNEKLKDLFGGRSAEFELVPFPSAAYMIPDEIGNGRPYLVLLHHDGFAVGEAGMEAPADVVRMASRAGQRDDLRQRVNNLVFAVADRAQVGDMKTVVRRWLALGRLIGTDGFRDLTDYQQRKVKEEHDKARTFVAISALQCYRHLFYPAGVPSTQGEVRLGHTIIELHNASDAPGNGQVHIRRALRDQKKLLTDGDAPDRPAFVRDNTSLRTRGSASTFELRDEYRRAPKLSILLGDSPFVRCLQDGVGYGDFVYRAGEQLWGPGDATPSIQISESAFIHTIEDAKRKGLWPRPAPPPPPTTSPGAADAHGATSQGGLFTGPGLAVPAAAQATTIVAEGPLRQALTSIFEQARSRKVPAFQRLTVKLFTERDGWAIHVAVAGMREADARCTFAISFSDEGIEDFRLEFTGTHAKANTVKSALQGLLASARGDKSVVIQYELSFRKPLATDSASADAFIAALAGQAGGEAWVEAQAAPAKEG